MTRRPSPSCHRAPRPRRPSRRRRTPRSAPARSLDVAMRSRSRTVSRRRRTLPASDTASRRRMRRELGDDAAYRRERLPEKPPRLRLVADPRLERLQDLLLAARAHSGEIAQPALLGGALEPVERGDPELRPDPRRRLRADSGSRRKSTTPAGTRPRRFVSACISPSSTTSTTLFSIVLPMPGSSFAFPSSASSAIGSGDSRMRPAARRYAMTLNDSSSRISERSASRSSWSASVAVAGQRLRHPAMIRRCLARSCASRRTTNARTSRR